MDDYINLNFDIINEWPKEVKINIFEDKYGQKEIDLILQNINRRKIPSAKFNDRRLELNILNNLIIRLLFLNLNKTNFYILLIF